MEGGNSLKKKVNDSLLQQDSTTGTNAKVLHNQLLKQEAECPTCFPSASLTIFLYSSHTGVFSPRVLSSGTRSISNTCNRGTCTVGHVRFIHGGTRTIIHTGLFFVKKYFTIVPINLHIINFFAPPPPPPPPPL